uniref:Tyrosine-protein kinase n=1 Tax=Panagrellus redivivus TaxID=6233 RepID=A0A7E4UP73_PANRE
MGVADPTQESPGNSKKSVTNEAASPNSPVSPVSKKVAQSVHKPPPSTGGGKESAQTTTAAATAPVKRCASARETRSEEKRDDKKVAPAEAKTVALTKAVSSPNLRPLPPQNFSYPTPIYNNNAVTKGRLKQISSEEAGGLNHRLEDEPYYHGFLSPAESEPLLKSDGDFLVRKAELGGNAANPTPFVISIHHKSKVHNYLIKRTEGKRLYWVNGYAFKTVPDLILFHYRNSIEIGNGVYMTHIVRKQDWQLLHEQVERHSKLGEGAFGEVWQGTLNSGVFKKKINVAIKTLHSQGISTDEQIKFLREANVMRKLNHPNVIKLYGVCTTREPIMIVMELAKRSLISRIKDLKDPPTVGDKVKYCYGASSGMAYLENMQIIHRDIAARNCLLGDNEEPKISDFGLSLLGMELREKKMKNVPVRWLAPETLKQGRYTMKTDVWSFGVMMWEIFSFCEVPYHQVADTKTVRKGVMDGHLKLEDPKDMPKSVHSVMMRCLTHDPDNRPSFSELNVLLHTLHNMFNPPTMKQKIQGLLKPLKRRSAPSPANQTSDRAI